METQNILQRKYTPINGDFYEKLEVAATHNDRCELIYVDLQGNEVNTISRIEDLYTHEGVEYAVLEDDTIRLDQIKSLNGEREEDFGKRKKRHREDFTQKFYSEEEVVVGDNDYYTVIVNRSRNIVELRSHKVWTGLDEIPDLKSHLITIADFMKEEFGLLNDLSELTPDSDGVLEAPFTPARGILINAGLSKVADLLPLSCDTLVHNRGAFSVNSIRIRSFKDRYFAENWLSER